jgi:hypothetical protein
MKQQPVTKFPAFLLSLSLLSGLLILNSTGKEWGTAYGQTVPLPPEYARTPLPHETFQDNDPLGLVILADNTGQTVRFSIYLSGKALVNITDITVLTEIPSLLRIKDVITTKGFVNLQGNNITLVLGNIAPGEKVITTITAETGPLSRNISLNSTAGYSARVSGKVVQRNSTVTFTLYPEQPYSKVSGNLITLALSWSFLAATLISLLTALWLIALRLWANRKKPDISDTGNN